MVINGCDMDTRKKKIKEGYVDYNITYLVDARENPLVNLLPNNMTVKFKNHKSVSKIEGWMGFFSSCYISNRKKGTNLTLFKILDKKYYYQGNIDEPPYGFRDYSDIKIKFTDETKLINGYLCKKAIATFPETGYPGFDIYYTNQIDIVDPNWNNQFKEIDGVLMEFQIEMNDIGMLLQVNEIKQKEIPDSEFDIPPDYVRVSREKMEEILGELL